MHRERSKETFRRGEVEKYSFPPRRKGKEEQLARGIMGHRMIRERENR